MPPYTSPYVIQPSDIDSNGHVNYAAYIDAAGNVRYHFFAEHGFTPEKFAELGMGPIYTAIHAQFMREVLMGETVTITYELARGFHRRASAGRSITTCSSKMASPPT